MFIDIRTTSDISVILCLRTKQYQRRRWIEAYDNKGENREQSYKSFSMDIVWRLIILPNISNFAHLKNFLTRWFSTTAYQRAIYFTLWTMNPKPFSNSFSLSLSLWRHVSWLQSERKFDHLVGWLVVPQWIILSGALFTMTCFRSAWSEEALCAGFDRGQLHRSFDAIKQLLRKCASAEAAQQLPYWQERVRSSFDLLLQEMLPANCSLWSLLPNLYRAK